MVMSTVSVTMENGNRRPLMIIWVRVTRKTKAPSAKTCHTYAEMENGCLVPIKAVQRGVSGL